MAEAKERDRKKWKQRRDRPSCAKVFYGFLVESDDCAFRVHKLWDELARAGIPRDPEKEIGIQALQHGNHDSHRQALAVTDSVVVLDSQDTVTAFPIPAPSPDLLDRWAHALETVATVVGVKPKVPRWYFAVEVS